MFFPMADFLGRKGKVEMMRDELMLAEQTGQRLTDGRRSKPHVPHAQ